MIDTIGIGLRMIFGCEPADTRCAAVEEKPGIVVGGSNGLAVDGPSTEVGNGCDKLLPVNLSSIG